MELSPPLTGRFESVNFEQVVQERQQHGVVVRKNKQVDCQQVGARLTTSNVIKPSLPTDQSVTLRYPKGWPGSPVLVDPCMKTCQQ